jgi:hypothetical protein
LAYFKENSIRFCYVTVRRQGHPAFLQYEKSKTELTELAAACLKIRFGASLIICIQVAKAAFVFHLLSKLRVHIIAKCYSFWGPLDQALLTRNPGFSPMSDTSAKTQRNKI